MPASAIPRPGGTTRGSLALFAAMVLGLGLAGTRPAVATGTNWWRGNLHTHSFWSDGDDFPESIADWYKTNGYHFLAFSDHNITLAGEKWVTINTAARRAALAKCVARFGRNWVRLRSLESTQEVKLKTLPELRPRFEEEDRFLLIPSEEISAEAPPGKLPIHLNATNLRDRIKPLGGSNVLEVLQRNIDAVVEQRRRTQRPILPHINHPNFHWAITAEDLMRVRHEQFFEVYNGHPQVRNEGNARYASVERIWDIMLAFRLTTLKLGVLYALAVDDAHSYHKTGLKQANAGRGWITVRTPRLSTPSLLAALEAGDFYASSGVRLRDVRRDARGLAVVIDAEPGVTYTTQFIGTRRGFDPTSSPAPGSTNGAPAATRVYSADIGAVLEQVTGPTATYTFDGDELYVRAKILSTKPKANPYTAGETETAWTQPALGPPTR